MFNLFENIKGFPLKAKSFRNAATYSKLWGAVPLIKIKTVQKIKSGIWEIKGGKYTDSRQDSGQKNISYTKYPKKCFTQIYRDLYGDVMLVPTWMNTHKADGNQ